MTEQKEVRLRPLQIGDVEAVASYGARDRKNLVSGRPDHRPRFLLLKKVKRLIDDRNAATFVADDGAEVVRLGLCQQAQKFITKEAYADFHSNLRRSSSQRGNTATWASCARRGSTIARGQKLDRVVFRTRAYQRADEGGAGAGRFLCRRKIFYERADHL